MQRSKLILISSLAVIVIVVISVVMMTRSHSPSHEAERTRESTQGEVSPEGSSSGNAVGSSAAIVKGKSSSEAANSNPVIARSTEVGGVKVEAVAAVEKKPEAPCQAVDLKSDVTEIKGHLNEFRLGRTLSSTDPLCVMVDGKSVSYTKLKDGRVRIEWKIAKSSSKVSATFCSDGVKCHVNCPEPEKDFWDTIGSNDAATVGTGFADTETANDKDLQKEIKALKDVLNRKPAEAPVANWTVVAQHDSLCK
ncbi:MAG: hypothetical protein ABIR96_01140 [Bdellovibrionota bacterium]